MPEISKARKAAFQILMAVERGHSHSDDLLRAKSVNSLSAPDRHLATALVLGVIRWQILLDQQLQALLKRPNAKLDKEILVALRLGAFQLLYLDRIPARAAIDESVELAKQAGHKFASGMVNAVLRKLKAPAEAFSEETPAELALAQAHPLWMVERWADLYGLDAARAICRHGQALPASTARIDGIEVEEELARSGVELEAGELLTAARTVVSGDVTSAKAFSEGRIRLQDEGSQLVAEIAGLGNGSAASAILDCCAAPGGKTLILAERNPAARIVAWESSAERLSQMRKRFEGNHECIECRLGDAAALNEDGVFDLALADVPCGGTGTLGRNPEIRHRLKVEDLARQAERQRAILAAALRAVRVGGRVVYSTCSLEPEENEQVVGAVLAADANTRLVPIESHLEAMVAKGVLLGSSVERLRGCITPEGALRLLPGVFNTDGFFIATMERSA
jgi:16S rRNA (cytosine967-C5)-methyltransferase